MKTSKSKTVCSWCEKIQDGDPDAPITTNTICMTCFDEVLKYAEDSIGEAPAGEPTSE